LRRASNLSTANYYDAKQNAVGQDDNLINFWWKVFFIRKSRENEKLQN
jgi:hypothetical protein